MARRNLRSAITVLGLVSLAAVSEPAVGLTDGRDVRDTAAVRGEAQDKVGAKRPFKHSDHVPLAWTAKSGDKWTHPETERDCRGCHVYEKGRTSDPQARCYSCHIRDNAGNRSTFEVSFEAGWDTLAPRRDPTRSFRHYQHAKLACRECHRPSGHGTAPDTMPIIKGFGECARCHAPDGRIAQGSYDLLEGNEVDPDQATKGFLRRLNADPAMLPANLGPFLHSDHLKDPQRKWSLEDLLARPAKDDTPRCSTCHDLEAGIAKLHSGRFKTSACGQCHIGQVDGAEQKLVFADRVEPASSHSALTFSHRQHLAYDRTKERDPKISSTSGYESIERSGCNACHEYDATANTFVFKNVKDHKANTHEGCRECHTAAAWSPGTHGEWKRTGCTDCHTFDRGSLASDRPAVSVRRHRASGFFLASHAHPHITADGKATGVYEKTCKTCHRARPAGLPSRVKERKFRHATHLNATPVDDNCKTCHLVRVAKAASPAEIGSHFGGKELDAGDANDAAKLGLSYDPQACGTCHRGNRIPRPLDERQPESRVPLFSHADHVGKAAPKGSGLPGGTIECLTCHRPGRAAGAGAEADEIGLQPNVLDCTRCHDHTGWKQPISGKISADESTSCAKCHTKEFPHADGTLAVQRARAIELQTKLSQHHPAGRNCKECHVATKPPLVAPREDHVFATGGQLADKRVDMHQHNYIRDMEAVLCFWCHWTRKSAFAVESPANRKRFGKLEFREADRVWTYPGGPYVSKDKAFKRR